MREPEQIGTVEIPLGREYPLDAQATEDPNRTWVVVPPGEYPVYSNGLVIFWVMTGTPRSNRLGDGLFTLGVGEEVGPEVTFQSKHFGPEEFQRDILDSPVAQPGPEQRLNFKIKELA